VLNHVVVQVDEQASPDEAQPVGREVTATEPDPLAFQHDCAVLAEEVVALVPEPGGELLWRRALVTYGAEQVTSQEGVGPRVPHGSLW
jgi:hypothetical protein